MESDVRPVSERSRRRASRVNCFTLVSPPPLDARELSNAVGVSRSAVQRFLSGRAGREEARRIRCAICDWLQRALDLHAFDGSVTRLFAPGVVATLDDHALVELLYWTRLVNKPRRRRAS